MAGEWETTSLDKLCEQIADCPHSTPLWTSDGVIVLCVLRRVYRVEVREAGGADRLLHFLGEEADGALGGLCIKFGFASFNIFLDVPCEGKPIEAVRDRT